ncbi:hypothetical protein NBRGN_031_00550 [Nocardia brasiliensis NBRC 14402]|uniref:phthiocerol/phthiodiolone dimycocerosyl transferase family protein n=1 Tax=Nocardia brasiliensis TaxID=37326 RepID=UPI0002ECC8F5|nr:hypothetical protein [Nocardia brasiliensis]ASF12191.1 hypothetical protein CEQ30_38045 [Nocardia brasiliensis]GAJ80859.1 hypothetical protein NBRGN_031_00550 [Nocardia brasiliensis NBRC 14402]SUB53109.1 Phthiocerol/phthiodiolone dimycocerosyl transferase [Nocardia brasiliensis]
MTIEPLTHPLVRVLDRSERMFAASGHCVGYSVRVRGRVDLESLRAAFSALGTTHPLLSCRLVDTSDGHTAFAHVDEPPLVLVTHGTEGNETSPDIENRTAAIHVRLENADIAWVTFLVHHSIADGTHAMRLLADLWTYYTDTVQGHVLRPRPQPYPRSLEQLLTERHIAANPTPELPVAPADRPTTLDPVPATTAHPRVELTAAETKALAELGHEVGATINSLVSAVLLRAVADTNGVDITDLRYAYPVNVRPRLTPAVSATEGTNVLGTAFFTPLVRMSTVALARAISDKLAIDLAAGRVQRHYLNTSEFLDAVDAAFSHRPGTVLAANWGVIPELSAPIGVTVDDFRPVWHGVRPVGGAEIPSLTPEHMGVILTFSGRLIVEIAQFDPRPDALTTHLRRHFDALLAHPAAPEAT